MAALAAACAVAVALPAAASAATWCGGAAESATDRPDTVAALSWHVVYAYPSDGADRFPQLARPIVDDLSAIDAWWRSQDATRATRWDVAAFPGCAGGVAALDLSAVKLPHDSTWYRGNGERWARLRDDLVTAGFGDPDKKFLVYFDGPLDQPLRECGVARTGFPATGGADSYALVYLDSTCGDGLGAGLFPAVAAVHEMTHAMNALPQVPAGQPGPPHACPGDAGHLCDNHADLLFPSSAAGVALATKVLDVGRDDYYGHSGSWWDVQDSPFLDHLDAPDLGPPGAPAGIAARTPSPGTVEVAWHAAPDGVGPVSYEVFRDTAQVAVTPTLSFSERISDGETHTYLVRPRDAVGRLGTPVSLRYTGGLGVVDASGALLEDTVPPSPVTRLAARLTRASLRLTWSAALDAGGVGVYRVYRDGKLVATTRSTSVLLGLARAAGTWTVRPFDRAGNRGELSPGLVVAPPRRPR